MTVVKAFWINKQKKYTPEKKLGETRTMCGYIVLGIFTVSMIALVCQTMAHIMSL